MESFGNSLLIYVGLLFIAGVLYYAVTPQLKRIADLLDNKSKEKNK